MLNPDLLAIIPVDQKTAHKRRWHMPHEPLHERLIECTSGRVILSDEGVSLEFLIKPLLEAGRVPGMNTEADQTAGVLIHDQQYPMAFEANRLASK